MSKLGLPNQTRKNAYEMEGVDEVNKKQLASTKMPISTTFIRRV